MTEAKQRNISDAIDPHAQLAYTAACVDKTNEAAILPSVRDAYECAQGR